MLLFPLLTSESITSSQTGALHPDNLPHVWVSTYETIFYLLDGRLQVYAAGPLV